MTASAQPQELLVRLLDPSNRADPYPTYAEIRERGALRLPEINLTVFSSYRDCDEVLRHPSAASDFRKATDVQARLAAAEDAHAYGEPSFLFLDPPDHTRLRKLVSKAFVPKVVKALEPDITALVDALLDTVAGKGTFDVIADLAHPLPVAVICRLLGVPLEDEPEFSAASALSVQSLDPFITVTGQAPENMERQVQAEVWLYGYLRDLISRRRTDLGDDLMSGLIQVEESGDQLTEEEIIATCTLLLVAGHETTVNLIANAVLAMLRQPEQWAALAENASRVSAVVEEALRYDPPVQLMGRIAADDMTIGETTVVKGDTTMLLLAAAHRDPAAYERPDEFYPDRESIRHLGFGKGPHFCLGAPLARLEAAVALSAVTARFPAARIGGAPEYKQNLTLRGMSSLPVAV
ncbi:MAG TPA: cytochrome P450 [Mycobacterium sp.]|jgi:cytochrome P450|nr:cytochrome P450 [Mycobacterium sp.]